MHPVLFRLPLIDWPVRMFGLFIIDAFFLATLWVQWRYAIGRNEAIRNDTGLARAVRNMLIGILVSRIVWIAIPGLGWPIKLIGVLAVDFFLGAIVWMKWRKAVKSQDAKEAEFVFNMGFWLLIVGFIGSRLFWIITTQAGRDTFVESPVRAIFAVWDGGIVWYGGLLVAAAFGAWYLWVKNRKILELGDICLVGISLALFVGRFACFSAGDDYGKETDVPWAVTVPKIEASEVPEDERPQFRPAWMDPATPVAHVHPSQLYMSLNGLILFVIGAWVLRRKRFDGQALYLSLFLYSIGRSIIELYRGDMGRGLYPIGGIEFSSSQLISIPVLLISGWMLVRGYLRSRGTDSATPTGDPAG